MNPLVEHLARTIHGLAVDARRGAPAVAWGSLTPDQQAEAVADIQGALGRAWVRSAPNPAAHLETLVVR